MSVCIENQESDVLVVKMAGRISASEWEKAQKEVSALLKSKPQVKVSLLVDGSRFDGWNEGMWGDLWFQEEHDAQIRRMAIVVEKQWESRAMLFAGKPFRKIDIKVFAPSEVAAARDWLMSSPRSAHWPPRR